MADELVFAVEANQATAARPVTFADAGLRERDHLQEWVIANPEILGPGIMIVTFEFDRWVMPSGQPTAERLDVLGLDQSGRLVVAELKRDRAPDSVTMQALNYAAMVSRFSLDTLAEAYTASRHAGGIAEEDALAALQQWAPAISDETLRAPRVMLLASEFGPAVTNLALFLYENGIDIALTRIQPYRTADGRHIVTVSRILPVPNAEDFMVKPRSGAQTRAATSASASRTDWDWTMYGADLPLPPGRVDLARSVFEALERRVRDRGLTWTARFRKGYVALQRPGGYNVLAVDMMWNRPVRLWLKLPAAPNELELEDPYPNLQNVWVPNFKEWGWHIDSLGDITDFDPVLDIAMEFHGSA